MNGIKARKNHEVKTKKRKPCEAQASSAITLSNSFSVRTGVFYGKSEGPKVTWKIVHLREQTATVSNGNSKKQPQIAKGGLGWSDPNLALTKLGCPAPTPNKSAFNANSSDEITSSRSQDFARGALMMILFYFNCGKLGLTGQTLMYLTIFEEVRWTLQRCLLDVCEQVVG